MKVYFIQSGKGGAVKIGKAKNVETRLRELQTGNPKELYLRAVLCCTSEANAFHTEQLLHIRFAENRLRGEWFHKRILKLLNKGSMKKMGITKITDEQKPGQ